jgi:hypothetical protein
MNKCLEIKKSLKMRNLLPDKVKYYKNFANSVYAEFQKIKYGIASCRPSGKLYVDKTRKDIVDYQANDDGEALSQVSINTMAWLPVYYPSNDTSCGYTPPWSNMSKYQIQRCSSGPTGVGMSYVGQGNSANIIEVNTGGCITRINLNPTINITNNATGASSFVFTQDCAQPQAIWNINHNLGYTPNAWTVDCAGNNISGTMTVINNNTIRITFSTAQAGKAYLS